jgi:hypothetical protein
MWILNFLAGDLIDDARDTPPYFDPASTWITADWSAGKVRLPVAYEAHGAPTSTSAPPAMGRRR